MSFTIVEQATPRLNRSELAVPGSNLRFIEKAASSTADVRQSAPAKATADGVSTRPEGSGRRMVRAIRASVR